MRRYGTSNNRGTIQMSEEGQHVAQYAARQLAVGSRGEPRTSVQPEEKAMTPKQITIVQSTFEQIRPMAEDAAALFYTRLFTLDGSLRALFKGDMQQQGVLLMH